VFDVGMSTSLGRYGDLVRLLVWHARPGLVAGADAAALGVEPQVGGDATDDARAEAFAADLERMGPTYIKLGQLLSTRFDLLPASYTAALARLQDGIAPSPSRRWRRSSRRSWAHRSRPSTASSTASRWRLPAWGRCTGP
jgi:Predicted unusual protein kinase